MIGTALAPMHPGEFLREEILPHIDLSKTALAERLGVSRQTLYDILGERQPVTPNLALRLGALFGNGAEIWLAMQMNYDLAVMSVTLAPEIAKIRALDPA